MSLILNVISVENNPPSQKMEHIFDEQGGTIGRKHSNNWILLDEDRHLSGSHAKIEHVNGDFYLVDTSTNGVFIDGSSSPLGRGERVKLNHGMRLGMGGYDIAVHLKTQQPVETKKVNDSLQNNPPFDWETESVNETHTVGSDLGDPIKKGSRKSQRLTSDDPFFPDDDLFFPNDDNKAKLVQDKKRKDNLSELDSSYKPPEFQKTTEKIQAVISNEIEADTEIQSQQDKDLDMSEQESLTIPDDWGMENESSIDDLLSGFDDPSETETETETITESVSTNDPKECVTEVQKTNIEETVIPDNENISDANISTDALFDEGGDIESAKTEGTQKEQVYVEAPSPNIEDNKKPQDNPQAASASIEAFLKGAGLDEKLLQEESTEQHLFLVGKLFRIAIQGTMEVLRSRTEIKKGGRMDVTTIQPIRNNPIKFSVNTNEALQRLLESTSKSYMDPENALNEAYDDIKAHQVAIIAGVQASLIHVLKRFEPDRLIKRLEEESPISSNIPIHRQAKLWNKFEDLYEAIEGEAEDDFNQLFGLEFAKAYDEQVALLKNKRSD